MLSVAYGDRKHQIKAFQDLAGQQPDLPHQLGLFDHPHFENRIRAYASRHSTLLSAEYTNSALTKSSAGCATPANMATASSQAQAKPFELAIIGGGIAGLMLAIALHKRNIACTIYEQAAEFGEIGAGVSISRNAVKAMEVIDRSVLGAFNIVATRNKWDSKKSVWFDFMDGMSQQHVLQLAPLFAMVDPGVGQNAVHRARFLDELTRLLPRHGAQFNKTLQHIMDDRSSSGKILLKFMDGSIADADAVLGCDGIKSRTRTLLVGEDHAAANPVYTHKYAYRGLIPMSQAAQVLGEERAVNASMWVSTDSRDQLSRMGISILVLTDCVQLGQNRHVLTFPVDHGATMNMVAFVHNDREEWPSASKLTLPTTKAEALDDFREFGQTVKNIIQLTSDKLERVRPTEACSVTDITC